jgi:hypothetical protein
VLLARIPAGHPPDATVPWTFPAARSSLLPLDALMQHAMRRWRTCTLQGLTTTALYIEAAETTQRRRNKIDGVCDILGLHRSPALEEPLLPLCDASTTGSTVRRQHEQDIVDPPSIIKLFQ